jgi:hypothetical protein
MRKIYNICLFVGVIALMLSACKKDHQNQIVQNTGEEVYWTAEDLKIQNNILSFQDKIKNNSFKSGETLELDSAVWYLEALMNYNYSTPDSSFVNLTVDTTFEFNLPVNDDLVDFSNLSEAAFAMEEHIVNYLNNMPNSIKFMVVADVHIKDDDFKSGSKTLSITTGYGSEYIDNPSAYTPFGENDYWLYGYPFFGGCETNNATSSDAAEEIEYKINNPNVSWDDPYPAGSYVVNVGIQTIESWSYPNPDDDQEDNWLDYLMYAEVDNNILFADLCLEPEEMNFYLQGTLDVIEMVIEEKQALFPNDDIEFVYLNLFGEMASMGLDYTYYLHFGEVTYGKRVIAIPPTN